MFDTLHRMLENTVFQKELVFYDAQIDKGNRWWLAAFPPFKRRFVEFYKRAFSYLHSLRLAQQTSYSFPDGKRKYPREQPRERMHERKQEQQVHSTNRRHARAQQTSHALPDKKKKRPQKQSRERLHERKYEQQVHSTNRRHGREQEQEELQQSLQASSEKFNLQAISLQDVVTEEELVRVQERPYAMYRERHCERAEARAAIATRADRHREEVVAASTAQQARTMQRLVVGLTAQETNQRVAEHVRVRGTEARRIDFPDKRISKVALEVATAPSLGDAQERPRPSRTPTSRLHPSVAPE